MGIHSFYGAEFLSQNQASSAYKVKRNPLNGRAGLNQPLLRPQLVKDALHFSGADNQDSQSNNDGAKQSASTALGTLSPTPGKSSVPRIYLDAPKNSRSPSPRKNLLDETVAKHFRPYKADNQQWAHYEEAAEPYSESLAEVVSRAYQNNAVLQVNDDEMKTAILNSLKQKVGDGHRMMYLNVASLNMAALETHYNSSDPLLHFFADKPEMLMLPKDKPVLIVVDHSGLEKVKILQTKGVLKYLHDYNPNYQFLFIQPKPAYNANANWGYPGSVVASEPKPSAQFQMLSVKPLKADQWARLLQKDSKAQSILKHHTLAFPEPLLKQFMESLQEVDPIKPLERESVLASLDSLGSFIRTRLKNQSPEVNEDLLDLYSKRAEAPPSRPLPPDVSSRANLDESEEKLYKVIKPESIQIHLDDVVGHESAKKVLMAALEMAEFPELYRDWNKGDEDAGNNYVLLMGEPGNGKTMMAKAIAAEGKGTFISTSGSRFVNKYVGVGADNVRRIEQEIKSLPQDELVVLCIDEIDCFSGKRGTEASDKEDHKTLTELLTMTDGLESSGRKLLIIATTNLPDSLDDALLSRFHYKKYISKPDKEQREQILEKQMTKKQLVPDDSVDLEELARKTDGLQGRDLRNLMKLAKLNLLGTIPWEKKRQLNQDPEARKAYKLVVNQKILMEALKDLKQGLEDVARRTAMSSDVAMTYT